MAVQPERVEKQDPSGGVAPAREKQIAKASSAALAAFSLDQIVSMPIESLLTMQGLLRNGKELGIWKTPPEWIAPGTADSFESVNLRARILHFLPGNAREHIEPALLEEAVEQLTRYLVLLRVGPAGLGRAAFRPLSPTSVMHLGYGYLPHAYALALARRHAPEPGEPLDVTGTGLLSLIRGKDVERLSVSPARYVRRECQRMLMLSGLGLWHDVPSLNDKSLAEAMTGPAQALNGPPARNSHKPLPDEYVALLGARTIWVVRELGPNLLALAEEFDEVWARTESDAWSPTTVRDRRRDAVKDMLACHAWVTSTGQPLERAPFPLALPMPRGFAVEAALVEDEDDDDDADDGEAGEKDAAEVRWPPQNFTDFVHLLGVLQGAHLVVALLSIGPRRSEILGLPLDCVVYAVDGRPYADGKTFKLVERHDGEERDWQLPELAVDAIEQQTRLVKLCERVAVLTPKREPRTKPVATGLWRRISAAHALCDPFLALRGINKALVAYARTLGLETEPGGQRLRSHRFRKTLARLVALALTQAPKLLMEVFGHKSLEMTLYYILTDKELRAEIEVVSRELRVMRAKEVVDAMVAAELAAASEDGLDFGGYGGIAATAIHEAVVAGRQEVHRTGGTWGAANAIELAELLTLQGTAWQQVRKGVLCTKLPGEAGPCNRSKGRPEPGKCSSACTHRLEEAFLREDVDATLEAAVSGYEQAVAGEDDLTAAHYAGQVRANLPRFASLRRKWSAHPTVISIVPVETAS